MPVGPKDADRPRATCFVPEVGPQLGSALRRGRLEAEASLGCRRPPRVRMCVNAGRIRRSAWRSWEGSFGGSTAESVARGPVAAFAAYSYGDLNGSPARIVRVGACEQPSRSSLRLGLAREISMIAIVR